MINSTTHRPYSKVKRSAFENMSASTWVSLADMKSMPVLFRGNVPYRSHCVQFVRNRVSRIERVSKMTLLEQCEHYRTLGYFKVEGFD